MKNIINKWFKRSMHGSMAVMLVAVLGIGLTMAYFTDVEEAINKIFAGRVTVEIEEEVAGLTKRDIDVVSNGRSTSYVRAKAGVPKVKYEVEVNGQTTMEQAKIVLENLKLEDSDDIQVLSENWCIKPKSFGTVVTLAKEDDAGNTTKAATWEYNDDDGFWYLSVTLDQDDSADFIKSITYPGLWDETAAAIVDPLPEGLTEDMLTIPIIAEAVQAENTVTSGATGAAAAIEAFKTVNEQNSQSSGN